LNIQVYVLYTIFPVSRLPITDQSSKVPVRANQGKCLDFGLRHLLNILLCGFFFLTLGATAVAREKIRVVGYLFPPFVNASKTGITRSLINTLNKEQTDFEFSFDLTSPARRYRDLSTGNGDVIFFEMPEWDWGDLGNQVEATREIMTGGEVYIAARKKGRDQSYFDDIVSKRIAALLGYHYGFADFNSDGEWLKKTYDIYLTTSHTTNIRIMLKDRVDITVVTEAFLRRFLNANPDHKDRVLISDKRDQTYSLKAIVRKGGPISAAGLEKLLDKIKESGALKAVSEQFGIESLLTY
jgi:polar amino acid transport system substrate-binding protein